MNSYFTGRIKSFLILLLVILLPVVSHAKQKSYTIEGVVTFPKMGKIYVYLVDEEVFKTPLTGIQTIAIEPNEKEMANKVVQFSFEGVQSGTYGIRCFQDTNGDGKLNKGVFGPSEPWGMSWKNEKPAKWPSFDGIAFDVNVDIKSLKIELQ